MSNTLQCTSDTPLVSVIIPAYNAAPFIQRTLNSVLEQTYRNLEVIVVDDGSVDRTAELVKAVAQKDSRLVLLQQSNAGVAAARNLGIQYSHGELIAPIDADDIWYAAKIEKQVQCFLRSSSTVGLIYSWSVDIDENDSPTGTVRTSRIEGQVYTTLLLHDFIANASSVLIHRNCLDKLGGYDVTLNERYGQGGEDWEIYLRIAEQYEFRVVPEVLVGYRQSSNSMSKDFSQMARSRQLIWQSIRQKYPTVPFAIEHLSNSSFYLHLANQCYESHQDSTAIYWLRQALQIDPIMPWFRLGTYRLLALALLNQFNAKPDKDPLKTQDTSSNCRIDTNFDQSAILNTSVQNYPGKFNFKSIAEQLLHRLAPLFFGTPDEWQNPELIEVSHL